MRAGIGALPEENAPPAPLRKLALPAIEAAALRRADCSTTLRTLRGVLRSLRIYYGGRHNRAAMDGSMRGSCKPGDLVFDVGSHVGDRIAAFRRLGARVVACEPQPVAGEDAAADSTAATHR